MKKSISYTCLEHIFLIKCFSILFFGAPKEPKNEGGVITSLHLALVTAVLKSMGDAWRNFKYRHHVTSSEEKPPGNEQTQFTQYCG